MSTRGRETETTRMRRSLVLLAAMALTLGMLAPASANDRGAQTEVADVVGQGPDGPTVAEDGATIRRTEEGIQVKVQMPTPEPGSYEYPEGDTAAPEGHPEVFTLWAFVFNYPENCVAGAHVCGGEDLARVMDPPENEDPNPSGLAVFGVAGHPVGGPNLTLSGSISTAHEPFAPIFAPLTNPAGAEVHLAVAPHGGLDPEIMPEQASTPAGDVSMWWGAVFFSPDAD